MYQTLTTNPPAFLHSKHNPTLSTSPSISNSISVRFKASASASTRSSRASRWSLHDMTALVTGGTRGIGLAIVEELTGLGAIVHTCARNEDELRKCLRDWKDEGLRVTGSVCDVSSLAERGKLIEDVSSVFSGKLNILGLTCSAKHEIHFPKTKAFSNKPSHLELCRSVLCPIQN